MPIVKMPDGTLVDMPDTPSQEQLSALAKLHSSTGDWSAKSLASDVGRGVLQGVDMLKSGMTDPRTGAGALGLASTLLSDKVSQLFGGAPGKVVAAAVMPQAEKTFPVPQGDTGPRTYVRKGLEGVGGAVTMPAGGLGPKQLASAAAGGVGGEASARLFGEGPLQRFLGGLAGAAGFGSAMNKLGGPRVQEASIAREALEGVTDKQLQQAQAMQAQAAKLGVKLDLAQALTASGASPNNLNTIRDMIANTKEGNATQTLLRNQPADVNEAVRLKAARIPGRDYGMEQAANNAQEAATGRINMAKGERSAAVRDDYAAAGELPSGVRAQFANAISEAMARPGTTPEAVSAMKGVLDQLKASPSTSAAMTHALDYDTLISSLTGPFKGTPLSPINPKAAGQVKGLAAELNSILKQASPELAQAEAKFAQISNDVVNPLKQGPVGQLAGRSGYLADRGAAASKLSGMFDAGVSPAQPLATSPIRTLGKELSKTDPEAFQDGFKSWLSSKIDKYAASDLTPGQAQPDGLAKGLYDELFRAPKRYQGIKDAVSVIAEQNGQNPADAVRGLQSLGVMLKGAANRPSQISGMSAEQLQQVAGHSLSGNALRVFGFLPFERTARWLEAGEAGKTFRTFDDLLTSPEGAATLAKLGRVPVMSEAARTLLTSFESGALQGREGERKLNMLNSPGVTTR